MTKEAKKPLQMAEVVNAKLGIISGNYNKTIITFFLLLALVILLNIQKYIILKVYLKLLS